MISRQTLAKRRWSNMQSRSALMSWPACSSTKLRQCLTTFSAAGGSSRPVRNCRTNRPTATDKGASATSTMLSKAACRHCASKEASRLAATPAMRSEPMDAMRASSIHWNISWAAPPLGE